MADDITGQFDSISDGLKSFSDELQNSGEVMKELGVSQKDYNKYMKSLSSIIQGSGDEITKVLKSFDLTLNMTSGVMNDTLIKVGKERVDLAIEGYKSMIDVLTDMATSPEVGLKGDQYEQMAKVVEAAEKQLEFLQKTRDIQDDITTEAAAGADKIMEKFESALGVLGKLPFGDKLVKSLKLDELNEEIKSNIQERLEKALLAGGGAFRTFGQTAIGVLKGIGMALWAIATNPLTWILVALGTILFIAKQVWDVFTGLSNAAAEYRKSVGATADQMGRIRMQIFAAATGSAQWGGSLEDATESASAISQEMGNLRFVTTENMSNMIYMNKLLGIGYAESAKLLKTFQGMDESGKSTLTSLIDTTKSLSQASNVAPGEVMKDIADNSEFIHTYFRGNVKEIARAAVNARKLGLNMSNVASITDSIMDFESSIEKELQASILLGKSINFNRARQLAFNGDIEAATKEVLDQVGGIDEFDKMNFVQKQAIAEATGLSVSQLREQLAIQKKIADDPNYSKNATFQLEATEAMAAAWATVKATLEDALAPVLEEMTPVVQKIAEGIKEFTKSDAFEELKKTITDIDWEEIGNKVIGLIGKIKNFAIGVGVAIKDTLGFVYDAIELYMKIIPYLPAANFGKGSIKKIEMPKEGEEQRGMINIGGSGPLFDWDARPTWLGGTGPYTVSKDLADQKAKQLEQEKTVEVVVEEKAKGYKAKTEPIINQQTKQQEIEKQKINFDEIFSPDKNKSMEEKLDTTNKLLYELLNKDANVYLDSTRVGYVLGSSAK